MRCGLYVSGDKKCFASALYRMGKAVFNMSVLQEQAVQMISGLSDDNVRFLIEIIHRLMPQKPHETLVSAAFKK